MGLFEDIDNHNEKLRNGKKIREDFEFKPYDFNYADTLYNMLKSNTIPDNIILINMRSRYDELNELYKPNSASDFIWTNSRFIDLLITIFTDNSNTYGKLKLNMLLNMDKINLKLSYILNKSNDNDFIQKISHLVEIIYKPVIDEIKSEESIDWNSVPERKWYAVICEILGQSTTNNGNMNAVAVLNNLIISSSIGDNIDGIINLYYIFFGKEFSIVALENAYPIFDDLLFNYHDLKDRYDKLNWDSLNKYKDGPEAIEWISMYKHMENIILSTREILSSLSVPDLVKILRIIDANGKLFYLNKSVYNPLEDNGVPKIDLALKAMRDL